MEPKTIKSTELGTPSSTSTFGADLNRPVTDPIGFDHKTPQTSWSAEKKSATERGTEYAEQAKQTLNEAYEKTEKAIGQTYDRALEYGTAHPGTMTLVALGVGVGVGFILAQNSRISSRSRAQRIVPPVMNALSQVVAELFD